MGSAWLQRVKPALSPAINAGIFHALKKGFCGRQRRDLGGRGSTPVGWQSRIFMVINLFGVVVGGEKFGQLVQFVRSTTGHGRFNTGVVVYGAAEAAIIRALCSYNTQREGRTPEPLFS